MCKLTILTIVTILTRNLSFNMRPSSKIDHRILATTIAVPVIYNEILMTCQWRYSITEPATWKEVTMTCDL